MFSILCLRAVEMFLTFHHIVPFVRLELFRPLKSSIIEDFKAYFPSAILDSFRGCFKSVT